MKILLQKSILNISNTSNNFKWNFYTSRFLKVTTITFLDLVIGNFYFFIFFARKLMQYIFLKIPLNILNTFGNI